MKILIVGAGRVGVSVAENLVSERNDITVVDSNTDQLAPLQEHFDLRVVHGDACQVSVLRKAGAEDADLLIACASLDAVNLVVCKLARQVFNVPRRIARVRSAELPEMAEVMGEGGFCVDAVISPERSVTGYLNKLIEFPEALQMVEFANGRLSVMALGVGEGSPLVARRTDELDSVFPGINARVIDVVRRGRSLLPRPELRVAVGDEALVIVDTQHARRAVRQVRSAEKSVRRVMIAGGGNIGFRVARELAAEGYNIRLIERDPKRCEYLAESLPNNVLVLHGSGTDEDLLEGESIEEMDTWLALTSDDEDNIMSSLLAKRLGARKVIALINRQAYGELMQGSHIDVAISPAQATMSELLRHVRRGDIVAVHRLRQGMAEALEVIAHGDRRTSKVVGRRVEEVRLPRGARIVALVRGEEQIIMADDDTLIETDDHVIVFAPTRRQIPQIEGLFQVSAAFF